MDPVERATEQLVEALCEAICAALRSKAFHPSERFQEELFDLVRSHVQLGQS